MHSQRELEFTALNMNIEKEEKVSGIDVGNITNAIYKRRQTMRSTNRGTSFALASYAY